MNEGLVLRTPHSRRDLIHCYAYLGERNPRTARRFRLAAEKTLTILARRPGIGELYEVENLRLAGLRCARVGRFRNYLIFYRPIPGGIHVVRVLHAARNVREILDKYES